MIGASSRGKSDSPTATEVTLLLFAVVAFLYFTGEILKPLALAVMLSFALAPAVRMFERTGLPRGWAVLVAVLIALGLLTVVGYVVFDQVSSLAKRLPDYQENVERKLGRFAGPAGASTGERLGAMAERVAAKLDNSAVPDSGPVQKVEVVDQPGFQDRLRTAYGPYVEYLGVGSFVLILVLFILQGRDDLRDRIVGVFGRRRIGLTTRTMQEMGTRITRYIATLTLFNACFGTVIGIGLALIGLPYAVLWGSLAALFRFIPYVGPTTAAALPTVFAFALFPDWLRPLEVIALFGALEAVLNSYVEPILYGKSTGVSPLGLLVAATFWTWLWGLPGLLLSTPLTVCLVVLGKYVGGLGFFAALMDDEVEIDPDVRLYQRLVALDRPGAADLIDGLAKTRPRAELFDDVLIPTLARAERDAVRGDLDESEQAFVKDVIGEAVDRLKDVEQIDLASTASADGETDAGRGPVVGIGVEDRADGLVLRMLAQVLGAAGTELVVIDDADSSLEVAQRVGELSPRLVVVSNLPPGGLRDARYLVRRLRSGFSDLEIVVGRWGEDAAATEVDERLTALGASKVVFSIAELRDRLSNVAASATTKPETAPLPA